MYSGISNDYLYSAYQIKVEFIDSLGKEKLSNGTAFFVMDNNKNIHLITNRHVIDLNFKKESSKYRDYKLNKVYICGKTKNKISGLPDINQEIEVILQEIRYSDKENDIAVFYKTQAKLNSDGSSHHISYVISVDLLADENKIKTELEVGDFVAFPSFQEWHDKESKRPILRLGTLASDPRYNYSNSRDINGDCMLYEAFSYEGSSGSPVFALQRGLLGDVTTTGARKCIMIGINAGHLKTTDQFQYHSGLSYLYKSSKILELIQ